MRGCRRGVVFDGLTVSIGSEEGESVRFSSVFTIVRRS